jgi:hypothetical protein
MTGCGQEQATWTFSVSGSGLPHRGTLVCAPVRISPLASTRGIGITDVLGFVDWVQSGGSDGEGGILEAFRGGLPQGKDDSYRAMILGRFRSRRRQAETISGAPLTTE